MLIFQIARFSNESTEFDFLNVIAILLQILMSARNQISTLAMENAEIKMEVMIVLARLVQEAMPTKDHATEG